MLVTGDGTSSHNCFNYFRWADAQGELLPISVSFVGSPYGSGYSQSLLEFAFNVGGIGDVNDKSTHYCGVLGTYTVDFGSSKIPTSYDWRSHRNACTNDMTAWTIQGSHDGTTYSDIQDDTFTCNPSGYSHDILEYTLDVYPGTNNFFNSFESFNS